MRANKSIASAIASILMTWYIYFNKHQFGLIEHDGDLFISQINNQMEIRVRHDSS